MSRQYRVEVTPRALKDLDRLRDLRESAVRDLIDLEQDPYKGHPLSGCLRGVRALEMSLGGVAYRAAMLYFRTSWSALSSWWGLTRASTREQRGGRRILGNLAPGAIPSSEGFYRMIFD